MGEEGAGVTGHVEHPLDGWMIRSHVDRRHSVRRQADHVQGGRLATDVETISIQSQTLRSLLVVHILGAFATGTLFVGAGSTGPTLSLLSQIPWWPLVLAVPMLVSSLTALLMHLSGAPRRVLVWPMRAIAGWYITMSAAYATAWTSWALAMAEAEAAFGPWHVFGSIVAVIVLGVWMIRVVADSPPSPGWVLNVVAVTAALWLAFAFNSSVTESLTPAPVTFPIAYTGTLGFLLLYHLALLEKLEPPEPE